MLLAAGYEAVGIDPEAPAGREFRQSGFEEYSAPALVDAVVACTSLHHVGDLARTLQLVAAALRPGGLVVVVEWARERFDEATVSWCVSRLPDSADPGWLGELFTHWRESGQPWDDYRTSWAEAEGLHSGDEILRALAAHFDSEQPTFGPYFFSDLAGTSEADEWAAITAGQIQANRIEYLGRKRGG